MGVNPKPLVASRRLCDMLRRLKLKGHLFTLTDKRQQQAAEAL